MPRVSEMNKEQIAEGRYEDAGPIPMINDTKASMDDYYNDFDEDTHVEQDMSDFRAAVMDVPEPVQVEQEMSDFDMIMTPTQPLDIPGIVPELIDVDPADLLDKGKMIVKEDVMSTSESTKPTLEESVMHDDAPAVVAATAATSTIAPKEGKKETTADEPDSPLYAAFLTSDALLQPRKSVENILRESKMAAVEEWHRSKTEEREMTLDEKVMNTSREAGD